MIDWTSTDHLVAVALSLFAGVVGLPLLVLSAIEWWRSR